MNVEIVTIGDELLIGQVVDTNSAWMSRILADSGFKVVRITAVGDNETDILEAIDTAFTRATIVLTTGGLGPTKDDITKKTLCKYFNSGMHFSHEVYMNIEELYLTNGRVMNALTRDQALVPNVATVIQNRVGTAPCTWFNKQEQVLISLPGVPMEMKWLMHNEIVPRLRKRYGRDLFIEHLTLWVKGYTESQLAIYLSDFENELPNFVTLAYLPQPAIIRLRLTATHPDETLVTSTLSQLKKQLYSLLKDHILADQDKAIEIQVGEVLRKHNQTIGTAESCTGGSIAKLLTSVPGSSEYFKGSIVSYANRVKESVLGVSSSDIQTLGAVSQEVVEQMATGAIRVLDCDYAIATSGIAGPTGGTDEKPIGTVWIAVANKAGHVVSEKYIFGRDRLQNITRSTNVALLMLLSFIEKNTSDEEGVS